MHSSYSGDFAGEQIELRERLVVVGHGACKADFEIEHRHLAVEQRQEIDPIDPYAASADFNVSRACGRMRFGTAAPISGFARPPPACWRSLASTSLRCADTGSGPDRRIARDSCHARGNLVLAPHRQVHRQRSGSPCRSAGCRPACCRAGRTTSAHRSRGSILCAPDPALFHCAKRYFAVRAIAGAASGRLHATIPGSGASSRNCSGSGTRRCNIGLRPSMRLSSASIVGRSRRELEQFVHHFGQLRLRFEHVGLWSLSTP